MGRNQTDVTHGLIQAQAAIGLCICSYKNKYTL